MNDDPKKETEILPTLPTQPRNQEFHFSEMFGFGFFVTYLLMGMVQMFAIFSGMKIWVGLTVLIIAWPVALFLAMLPIVGTVLGILGAVKAWGWSWHAAVLLFVVPWFLLWLGSICFGIADIKRAKREDSGLTKTP